MSVRYRRENDHSYLIMKVSGERDYQIKMVMENNVEGLLRTDIRRLNGEEEYYYDITGKQSLENIFLKKPMGYEDIRGILLSIYHLNQEIKRYLLDIGRIYFNPELCFYNPDKLRAEWVFGEETKSDYSVLAEFILEHADHEDRKGVDIGYKFYKYIKEETFTIEKMLAYIEDKYPRTVCEEEIEEWMPSPENEADVKPYFLTEQPPLYTGNTSPQGKLWENVIERCSGLLMNKREKKKVEEPIAANRISSYTDFENRRPEKEVCTQTMLITPAVSSVRRQLRGMGRNEIIKIPEKLPCIIGKDKNSADIVIKSNAVSRVHARIYKQEEKLFLQDLNSKNGTLKNGLPLEPNEKTELCPGDEICFANLQYIYE